MRIFLLMGKLLALLFWLSVLGNLLYPLAEPFAVALNTAGALLLGIHMLELLAFNHRLKGRQRLWLDRLLMLLFGVFHLLGLKASQTAQ